jgi:hypothetical protein
LLKQVTVYHWCWLPQVTCNVHGVAAAFLDIGRAKAAKPPPGQHRFTKVRQLVTFTAKNSYELLLLCWMASHGSADAAAH